MKRISTRRFASLAMMLVMLLSMVTIAANAEAANPVLNVAAHLQYDFLPEALDAFKQAHPEYSEVNLTVGQHIDSGVYAAMLQADDCPDLLLVGSGASRIMPLAEAGLIMDLTDIYMERGWDKRVLQSTMDTLKLTSNDHIYEVSMGMDVFTFKYFKSEFEELGLNVPTTYEEYLTLLQALKDAGRTPVGVGVMDNVMGGHMVSAFWQAFCGSDYVRDMMYNDVAFNDAASVKAVEELRNFVDQGFINKNCMGLKLIEATAAFSTKQMSSFLCSQAFLDQFAQEGLDINDIGSFVIPSVDPSKPSLPIAGLAQCWVVPSNSKNVEGALAFLDYFLSDEYVKVAIELEDKGSWNTGIAACIVTDKSILDTIHHPIVKDAYRLLEEGYGFNCSPYLTGNLKTIYFESMQNVFAGVYTPQQAMDEMQRAKEEQ